MIISTADIYYRGSNSQKALLETLVGAAIWYLPNVDELFTERISIAALAEYNNATDVKKVKLVEEHPIPRKVAGNWLYSEQHFLQDIRIGKGEKMKQLYLKKFGKYNLVLKHENDRLKKYQKLHKFIDEDLVYKAAGIDLVHFSIDEYKYYKKHFNRKTKSPEYLLEP